MIRVAMIGAGGIARVHLTALAQLPACRIVAHVSASEARARTNAVKFGGGAFADLSSALDTVGIDAVWICVPPFAHGQIEEALIRRRVPFFVEKPLAADGETPERLARMLDDAGLVTAVGYHWRAMDTIPEVRAHLRAAPPILVQGLWLDTGPPPSWWYHRATGGGQMLEQATHLIDLARVLTGEAALVSAAAGPVPAAHERDADFPGASTALLRFAGDIPGVFTATWLLPARATVCLQLVCASGLITIDRREVTYDEAGGRRAVPVREDPFASEDRAFIRAVTEGDAALPYCTYGDALRTHRLCWEVTTRLQERM